MHELGIARDLIKQAISMKGDTNIKRIVIVIGEASGIEEHFLTHSFEDHIFPEMGLDDVVLEIKKEKPKLRCEDCGYEMDDVSGMTCEKCGSFNLNVAGGQRVYVESVE